MEDWEGGTDGEKGTDGGGELWTFVGRVMFLLFNMQSNFVIALFQGQASFHFMAAVTIHSDFGGPQNKSLILVPLFPLLFVMK